jgi:hypothetical protein
VDANARDDQPPEPNAMRDGNEDLHKHHLYITVFDKVPGK